MVGFDNSIPGLRLGLGLGHCMMKTDHEHRKKKKEDQDPCNKLAYPSLKLGLPDHDDVDLTTNNNDQLILATKTESEDWFHHPHTSNSPSAVSSLISNSCSIKRERDQFSGDEELELDVENTHSKAVDVEENGSPRKKLRLTKQQSLLLEDIFKQHSTLNLKQKQELARKLNLRTRQVEVWFQNRRARTKLKQTESNCELLKKCCETLTEENKRLQKELQEIKSMMKSTKPDQTLYMQLPLTSLTICSSCKRIRSGESNNGSASSSTTTTAFTISPKRSIITSIGASYS